MQIPLVNVIAVTLPKNNVVPAGKVVCRAVSPVQPSTVILDTTLSTGKAPIYGYSPAHLLTVFKALDDMAFPVKLLIDQA